MTFPLSRLPLLFRTIRYLRPVQIRAQCIHRLRHKWEHPETFACRLQPGKAPKATVPAACVDAAAPHRPQGGKHQIPAGEFTFLNTSRRLGWPPCWKPENTPKLWEYHLHYQDWLWLLSYPEARTAVKDWIARYPLQKGQTGWESYPIALRIVNWTALFWGKWASQTREDAAFQQMLWDSLFTQTQWLARHLEYHLMGNHLLEDGCALAFVAAFFDQDGQRGWRRKAARILEKEIPEQILPDGMHFERSPMYHQRVCQILLALVATQDPQWRALCAPALPQALQALRCMCHPDGDIALFNDAALGVYPAPATLLATGEQLGLLPSDAPHIGPFALPDAGYYGFHSDNGDSLICDVGPIGPDYIPGHAHGDMLSFELSIQGKRFFVDSGLHDYEQGAMREHCRATRAHNTVEIEKTDQCEFWGAFRVGRRGYPHDVQFEQNKAGFRLSAWHDGYTHLKGHPRHHRRFDFQSGVLTIHDTVTSQESVKSVGYFHLHPNCRILKIKSNSALLARGEIQCQIDFTGQGELRHMRGCHCPRFGLCEEAKLLFYEFIINQDTCLCNIQW